MKLITTNRVFEVNKQTIKEIAKIELDTNEMITFIDKDKEFDFVAKEWGYYATPSINSRLKNFGYKTALVKNSYGKLFINVVKIEQMERFLEYLKNENSEVLEWLDEVKI